MTAYTMYGAAITPAILFALFSKRVTPAAGLAGIIVGGLATIVWTLMGTPRRAVRHRGSPGVGDRHFAGERRHEEQRPRPVSGCPLYEQLTTRGRRDSFCPCSFN